MRMTIGLVQCLDSLIFIQSKTSIPKYTRSTINPIAIHTDININDIFIPSLAGFKSYSLMYIKNNNSNNTRK